jgi:hypothetical protein
MQADSLTDLLGPLTRISVGSFSTGFYGYLVIHGLLVPYLLN